jgi:hypothetical protein
MSPSQSPDVETEPIPVHLIQVISIKHRDVLYYTVPADLVLFSSVDLYLAVPEAVMTSCTSLWSTILAIFLGVESTEKLKRIARRHRRKDPEWDPITDDFIVKHYNSLDKYRCDPEEFLHMDAQVFIEDISTLLI